MGSRSSSYSHFIHEAIHNNLICEDHNEYLWKMLDLSRKMNLVDSNGNKPTLGWVAGFLCYFGLYPIVTFSLDSLADIHQFEGWNDAGNYPR